MDIKLTLKLDKAVIEKAKHYAALHKISLSRMIEAYLKSIVEEDPSGVEDKIGITPFIRSMSTGMNMAADIDHKKLYGNHQEEKHK